MLRIKCCKEIQYEVIVTKPTGISYEKKPFSTFPASLDKLEVSLRGPKVKLKDRLT